MGDTITIPKSFRAVVVTPPRTVDSTTLPRIQEQLKKSRLDRFDGHRILHMHQVEEFDSSVVATLLHILEAAREHGKEFLVCDPPPIVRAYLEIYGQSEVLQNRVLSSANDGTYTSELVGFVPPFVPNPSGRVDVYEDGAVRSYEMGGKALKEIAPVDLGSHPPKAPTRASHMEVSDGEEHHEIDASAYVFMRRHNCGCGATHSLFDKLYQLHDWFRAKGFDFKDVELWASDVPAGVVTEKLTFRDRAHYDQFRTLLKIDSAWKDIGAPMEDTEEEFYYVY